MIVRNIIFEQIIEKFSAIELAKEETSEKPKIQQWGKRFVTRPILNEPTRTGNRSNLEVILAAVANLEENLRN